MSNVVKHQAFMAHIPHSDISGVLLELLKEIKKDSKYLLALESQPYQHIHFLCEMSDDTYSKFAKRIFIDKYKLRGRALSGKPRQYGKLTKIKNLERLQIYMLKGLKETSINKYVSNMDQEYLAKLHEKSFQKKKTPCQEFQSKLKEYVCIHLYKQTQQGVDSYDSYYYLELKDLVSYWILINPDKCPPIPKTLAWLAYKANVITKQTFIEAFYETSFIGHLSIKCPNQLFKLGKLAMGNKEPIQDSPYDKTLKQHVIEKYINM